MSGGNFPLTPIIEQPPVFRPPHNFFDPPAEKPRIKQSIITYFMQVHPANNRNEKTCTICQDEFPDTFFCSSHLLHLKCLIQLIYAKSANFVNNTGYTRTDTYTKTDFSRTYEYSNYKVKIPEKNLPQCPECRGQSVAVFVKAQVEDIDKGWVPASVEMEEEGAKSSSFISLPIFDQWITIYTIFQTLLSQVQRKYPDVNRLQLQNIFTAIDIAIVTRSYTLIYKEASKRWKKVDPQVWYKKHAGTIIILLLSTTVLTAALVEHRFKSTLNLDQLLKNSFPPESLGSISGKWTFSYFQLLSHVVLINRIFTEAVLSYFSPNKTVHISRVILQTISLKNFMHLRWLTLEKTMPSLKKIPFEVKEQAFGKNFFQETVQNIKTSFSLLVSTGASLDSTCSSIKTIDAYTQTVLNNSVWHIYWSITKQNHAEVSRLLVYELQLQQPELKLPSLSDFSVVISSIVFFYGKFVSYANLTYKS